MIHFIYKFYIYLSVQIRTKASVRDSLDKNMTYRQFCLSIMNGAVYCAKSVDAKGLGIVADMYQSHSIKGSSRKKIVNCTGIIVSADDILIRRNKLNQYLTNDDFKVDFNKLFLEVACDNLDTDLEFVITDGFKVLKVNDVVHIKEKWSDIDDMMEKADNRVLLHIKDAINCVHQLIH